MSAMLPPSGEWDGVKLFGVELKSEDETCIAQALLIGVSAGKWIAATPDLPLEILDLTNRQIVSLRGDEASPAETRRDCSLFDPLSDKAKCELLAEAVELARAMGNAVAPAASGVWRVADMSSDKSGKVMENDLLRGDYVAVRRDSVVCTAMDEDAEEAWARLPLVKDEEVCVRIQLVKEEKLDSWKELKFLGPPRDRRLAPGASATGMLASADPHSSVETSRAATGPPKEFRGGSVTDEPLAGAAASGSEPCTYDTLWVSGAGLSRSSTQAHVHRILFTLLYLLQSFDLPDMPQSRVVDFTCRWILMIQAAVRRDPESPNLGGAESYPSQTIDVQGGVVSCEFTRFVADEQRVEARVKKQQRLLREEVEAENQRKDEHGGAGGSSGGGQWSARERREEHKEDERGKREKGETGVGADKADNSE